MEYAHESVQGADAPVAAEAAAPTLSLGAAGGGSGRAAPLVRRAMVVGAADDASERDADRVAEQVLARLHGDAAGAAAAAAATTGPTRIQRSAAAPTGVVGRAGGPLDDATTSRIQAARGGGAPLAPDVRNRMEAGFGTDLGHVSIHRSTEASALNESISAQAFTLGNDVFLHGSTPDAGTAAGDRVLAHEIAHVQQADGGVHRLWSVKQFKKETDEGFFTRKSTAQEHIEKALAEYTQFSIDTLTSETIPALKRKIDMVIELRDMAKAWISGHTLEVDGNTKEDPDRVRRMAAMKSFASACNEELMVLTRRQRQAESDPTPVGDVAQLTMSQPSERLKKVQDHYAGDASSAFRRLGWLIDAAAPTIGDSAKVSLAVQVPVAPGAYVGFEFAASASREEGKVSVSVNLGVTGGGDVGVAKLGAALGGYLKATAATGADCAELMSYALFRRCRESNLIPREIENYLWGGNSGSYGWQKAENWSLGVEERILGTQDGSSVETGGYVSGSAKAKVADVLELGGTVKGTLGTKVDKGTLETRKGGVGEDNLRSGTSGSKAKAKERGAQKSVGVGTGGLEIGVNAKVGPFAAALGAAFGWTSDGAHGKKTVKWTKFDVTEEMSFTVPSDQLIGTMRETILPGLVTEFVKLIRVAVQHAEGDDISGGGMAAGDAAIWAKNLGGLAKSGGKMWDPLAKSTPKPGTTGSMSTKYQLTAKFDFMKGEMAFSLNVVDSGGVVNKVGEIGKTTDLVNLSVEKSSRMFQIKWDGDWHIKL